MAGFMREAGYSPVEVEPILQPLTGEKFKLKTANKTEEARSDIKCLSFWKTMRQAFFDIKVISPYARSYVDYKPEALFKKAEQDKMREYRARILEVEHADFTPLVFTCAGGIAPQSQMVLKRLAERISEKQGLNYSQVAGWLRAKISFSILKTTILCIRATRERRFKDETNIALAVSSTQMDY